MENSHNIPHQRYLSAPPDKLIPNSKVANVGQRLLYLTAGQYLILYNPTWHLQLCLQQLLWGQVIATSQKPTPTY